ncbi:hypothetical protein ALC57_16983 [Trachymyrmex cornetzi]|uniref:Endonuclease/exonuclease/phosphatase domain-containing protein n=1 Tax=Trachymyrmex cornetzi TaxID=471704 RepID=A0A151ITZ2_9HYME|nr:hypothetical protein ALC57_16983 [Trachymyrmex cornetzi]
MNMPLISSEGSNSNGFDVLSTTDVSNFKCNVIDEPKNKDNSGESVSENPELLKWLCSWKTKHNITHVALTDLLKKLRTCGHNDLLPNDARTLLNTPRNSMVEVLANNDSFFHYGLKTAIIKQLARTKFVMENDIIMIDLNIDGLPISKSSKSQIWSILGKIYGDKAFTPFVISAYHGHSKPASLQNFLTPFCQEFNILQNTGLIFDKKRYTIKIRSVICDSPARAFVTCTKAHNGFFGCGKCMQEGIYSNHHMLFLESTAPLRTDLNFNNRVQEDHHTGVSPFESIKLGMVSQFPLDYMHLFLPDLLGSDHYPIMVQVNCLVSTSTVFSYKVKLSKAQRDDIELYLFNNANSISQAVRDINPDDPVSQYNTFMNLISASYERFSPSKPPPTKTSRASFTKKGPPPTPWWTPDCTEAVRRRSNALKTYKQSPTWDNYVFYRSVVSQTNKILRRAKRVSWRKFCCSLDCKTPTVDI